MWPPTLVSGYWIPYQLSAEVSGSLGIPGISIYLVEENHIFDHQGDLATSGEGSHPSYTGSGAGELALQYHQRVKLGIQVPGCQQWHHRVGLMTGPAVSGLCCPLRPEHRRHQRIQSESPILTWSA